MVTYRYDSWGLPLGIEDNRNADIAGENPFRYCGYCYDEETGFYYLKSRYYDPEVGRFINADGFVSTGTGLLGYNMYAYCNDNPIKYKDSDGNCITNARGDRIPYRCTTKCRFDYRAVRNKLGSISGGKNIIQTTGNIVLDLYVAIQRIIPKPNNIGEGTYRKIIQTKIDSIETFSTLVKKSFDTFDVFIIGYEMYINAEDNYVNNQGCVKILWDGAVDAGVLITNACLTAKLGAAMVTASVNPIAAAIMLFAAGWALDESGKLARGEMKTWVK